MKIWLIIMISLHVRPITSVHENLWGKSGKFRNLFRERLRYIKANLTTNREAGLILYFPNHPGGELAEDLEDQYVDVNSAFSVLRRKYSDLPLEVSGLEASTANLPISTSWYAEGAGPVDQLIPFPALKRDQTKSIVGRMNNNLQTLVLRFIEREYGALTPDSLDEIRHELLDDLKVPGLGADAIRTQLQLLLSHRESANKD
ncbi:hypothetical protein C7T35_10095 [Variovorax sp. WS11]|nr:hypothetical protein C7T35_10095 [Variovorax sp. WS11]